MPSRRSAILLATVLLASLAATTASAESSADITTRFATEEGLEAIQPGCTTFDYVENPCHQIATMMNGLDSPKIDILILVPASPTAERDMRIMRQSVEMWEDGFHFLAKDMGLGWLDQGVEFHIAMEMINTGESEFTTYPIVDPEIVVVATNPAGGLGIGVDPVDLAGQLFGEGAGQGPCHGVKNPFDMALWEALPGYDSHHGGRGGTYTEDCGGAGGNICFSVNGAIDPATSVIDFFQLYDLVSHETGHCLTLGHVGDGAEDSWSKVPTNDIMAYDTDPPGVSKCVSTLDVEALAVSMSRFLDVNGDGVVNSDDYVHPNTPFTADGRPFQVQSPDNHYYASATRKAIDCPQPDMGPVPLSEVVNFTPAAQPRPQLAIASKAQLQGQHVPRGVLHMAGAVANGTASQVVLNVLAQPVADPGNRTGTVHASPATYAQLDVGIANRTVAVGPDGRWSGEVDLSSLPNGAQVVVSALWSDAQGNLVDSDRVTLVVDGLVTDQPVQPQRADTPAPAFTVALLAVVAALALSRRK